MTDTPQTDASQTDDKVGQAIRDLAALSIVFSKTLTELNEIAAKQLNSLLEIAINAAKAAHSLASHKGEANAAATDETFAPLLARLKEASDSYASLNQKASPSLDNAAAVDATVSPEDQLATLVNLAYANTIANTNLAQQNAIANQQAMNQLGVSVLGKSVSVVFSSVTYTDSDQAIRHGA